MNTRYSAIVIQADKNKLLGDLLAIAQAEAKKRCGLKKGRIEVHEILFVPKLEIHVAVYSIPGVREERMKHAS